MKPTKQDIATRFGKSAGKYSRSAGHAKGADLDIVLRLLAPDPSMVVLDVATGAGHTACHIAPRVQKVVAIDLSEEMIVEALKLAAKKKLLNVEAKVMDVESLKFADGTFDAATCRIAPHHFPDIEKSLSEIARVLKPHGVFVVEDSVSPELQELDSFLNEVERMRDHTHIRSYTQAEWFTMLKQAGLQVGDSTTHRKIHNVDEWISTADLNDQQADAVRHFFLSAPTRAIECFEIFIENGKPVSYTDDKLILRAVKT